MGFFDESSDEEDDAKLIKLKLSNKRDEEEDPLDAFMTRIESTAKNDLDESASSARREMDKRADDAEDPLDAYMKGLSSSSAKSSSNGSKRIEKCQRLDLENEEESTAHWHNDTAVVAVKKHDFCDEAEDSDLKSKYGDTFHRAGSASGSRSSSKHKNRLDDDDDDEFTSLRKKKRKDDSMLHLPKVNHNTIKYEMFNKCFYRSNMPSSDTAFIDQGKKEWIDQHHITITDRKTSSQDSNNNIIAPTFQPALSFEEAASKCHPEGVFPSDLLMTLTKLGYVKPTAVQSACIPIILSGRDVLVTASTGSGKTLAFCLPMVIHACDQRHIEPGIDGPICVVLSPTRELALQTNKCVKSLLKVYSGARSIAVVGGDVKSTSKYEMTKDLQRGCEVIIATPGRMIDMLSSKATNLTRVTIVILDEADRMLEMGFEHQVRSIMQNTRPDRQTCMFSATFRDRIRGLAEGWLTDPVRIAIGVAGTSSSHVVQHVIVLPNYDTKRVWLKSMLPTLAAQGKMIIFVASRADCENVAELLRNNNSATARSGGIALNVGSIHGDKDQRERNANLSAFKKGHIHALVATDVAARGLDVQNVTTVINFDVAKSMDGHVHRIGRAGRMSAHKNNSNGITDGEATHKEGVAYTLVTSKNCDFANSLVDAFRREGREISKELLRVASQSRHYSGGRGQGKNRHKKLGLGFTEEDTQPGTAHGQSNVSFESKFPSSSRNSNTNSYYGPT